MVVTSLMSIPTPSPILEHLDLLNLLKPPPPSLSLRYHLWMTLKKADKIVRTFSSHFMCTSLYLHPQYSLVPLSEKRSKCIKNKMHNKEDLTYAECYSLNTECSYI